MKAFVTGATGFLGTAVVSALRERDHDVVALVRPETAHELPTEVGIVRGDLRAAPDLVEALRDVDVVVHCAAVKSGDLHSQYNGTVRATEALLDAVVQAGVGRFVLVSSFSVYDAVKLRRGDVLDEEAPLVDAATARDAYAATKRLQEEVVERAAHEHGIGVTIARPGFIYGPGNVWSARLGYRVGGGTWVGIGGRAPLPATYVGNCADAIVLMAERHVTGVERFNVVDDDPPTQRRYRSLLARGLRPSRSITVPWPVANALVSGLHAVNQVTGGRLVLPGALRRDDVITRWRPLHYVNNRLRAIGWRPRTSLDLAVRESTS